MVRAHVPPAEAALAWVAHTLLSQQAPADLAREAAGAGADLGDAEPRLALVLADDVQQVADVARRKALHERVGRVQLAVLRVLHNGLDRVLRAHMQQPQ